MFWVWFWFVLFVLFYVLTLRREKKNLSAVCSFPWVADDKNKDPVVQQCFDIMKHGNKGYPECQSILEQCKMESETQPIESRESAISSARK